MPIKNRVLSVDEHTTFLAHYDISAEESLHGISPVLAPTSLNFNANMSITAKSPVTKDDDFTISFWMKHNNPTSWTDVLTLFGASQDPMRVEWDGAGNYRLYGQHPYESGKILFTHNGTSWDHIVLSFGRNSLSVYKNGVRTGFSFTVETKSYEHFFNIRFGARLGSQYWRGQLSEIMIVDRALTQEEAELLYQNPKEIEGVVGYWKLNEGQGQILHNLSKQGEDILIPIENAWSPSVETYELDIDGGRFGGGISIYEQTQNLIETDLSLWSAEQGIILTKTNEKYKGQYVYKAVFPASGLPRFQKTFSYLAGDTFTASIYYRYDYESIGYSQLAPHFYLRESNYGTTHTGKVIPENENWNRISLTHSFTTAGTSMFLIYRSETVAQPVTMYFTMPQLEKKSFATSFTEGIRANAYLTYPSEHLTYNTEGTFSCWAKTHKGSAEKTIISTTTNQAERGRFALKMNPAGTISAAYGESIITSSVNVNDGEWHHYAVTWKNQQSHFKLYVDGHLAAEHNPNTNPTISYGEGFLGRAFPIGHRGVTSPDLHWNGVIDEVRVDSIVRTADEIMSWYYSNSPFYPRGIIRKTY